MRYLNKEYVLADSALRGILLHLHRNKGLGESRCLYKTGSGDTVRGTGFDRPAFGENDLLEIYIIGHGLSDMAGIGASGADTCYPDNNKNIKADCEGQFKAAFLLAEEIFEFLSWNLNISKAQPLMVRVPFCHGSLQLPSWSHTESSMKAEWADRGIDVELKDLKVTEIRYADGRILNADQQQAFDTEKVLIRAAIKKKKDDFLALRKRFHEQVVASAYQSTQEDAEFIKSLAEVLCSRLAQKGYANVRASGFLHEMSYPTQSMNGRAPFKPYVQKFANQQPQNAARHVKRTIFGVAPAVAPGQRYRMCYFPFHMPVIRTTDMSAVVREACGELPDFGGWGGFYGNKKWRARALGLGWRRV